MLKSLKVSALAQKWVFYRSEVIGNGEPQRIEVLSFGNAKIYQPIELKDEMKKNSSIQVIPLDISIYFKTFKI